MTLPEPLLRLIEDATTAAAVCVNLDLSRAVSASLGHCGVLTNCNFKLNLLVENNIALRVTELRDGRLQIEAIRTGP